jgi:hypothetical protein
LTLGIRQFEFRRSLAVRPLDGLLGFEFDPMTAIIRLNRCAGQILGGP